MSSINRPKSPAAKTSRSFLLPSGAAANAETNVQPAALPEPTAGAQDAPPKPASPQIDAKAVDTQQRGLVAIRRSIGPLIEIVFSALAAMIFASLLVFLFATSCEMRPLDLYLIKSFALMALITSAFLVVHNTFDRRPVIGRGLLGYILFFVISGVTLANLIGAFWAVACVCTCLTTRNAFSAGSGEDLVIFSFELTGSLCLLIVLLVAAVSRK